MTALLDRAQDPHDPPAVRAPAGRLARLRPLATRGGWLASLAVTLLAGLLRFVRLDLPDNTAVGGKVFDEVYYACDALNLLRYGVEHATESDADDTSVAGSCTPTGSGSFVVHPPLGKWAIALGIRAFGDDPFGWRVAAAVAGTLTVLAVVRVGRRMLGSTLLGCLAGVLLALDGLHFVQSRVAMLDVFLVLWITTAFACLVADRDQLRGRLARGPDARGPRPWRLAAGVCLGAAVASKWSGLYPLAVLVLLAVAWEVGARRTAGVPAPFRATVARSAGPMAGALVLLPLTVYLLSWTGWFLTDLGWDRQWAAQSQEPTRVGFLPDALRSLWHYHQGVLSFHDGLSAPHPYESHPAGWLLLARPISYYYPPGITTGEYGCEAERCAREVLAIGNPALWWVAVPVLVALLWRWATRRDWRAGAIVALVLVSIVPWVRDDLQQRTMFLFYALPAVPFMALGTAFVGGWLLGGPQATRRRRGWGAAAVGVHTALVVAAFAFFYPVLAAQTISSAAWADRMWFASWV